MRWMLVFVLLGCVQGIPVEEGSPIQVWFCPEDNCSAYYAQFIRNATGCALYDAQYADVDTLVMEQDNALIGALTDQRQAFMHHKFCVGNGVLTGSMNPTYRGMQVNYNNLLHIPSAYVQANFAAELEEMRNGIYGDGDPTPHPDIVYNNHTIQTLFCPEDPCKETVLAHLQSAKTRIRFLTFSFTDKDIADMLLRKHRAGVDVRGIMEGQRKNMRYNQYHRLKGLPLLLEDSSATMHHKIFLVDDTVITGSANPTKSGYARNDEVLLILEHPHVVQAFTDAYARLADDLMTT